MKTKTGFLLLLLLHVLIQVSAQQPQPELPIAYLAPGTTPHFISPEPIQYVDISTDQLVGDLPLKQVFRIKLAQDLPHTPEETLGVVTIIGQTYIAQYELRYSPSHSKSTTRIEITPAHTAPIDVSGFTLGDQDLRISALQVAQQKRTHPIQKQEKNRMKAQVNHLFAMDDYLFLDLTLENKTQLPYAIDQINFQIQDRKVGKATNVQSLEMTPVFQLHRQAQFQRRYHNVFVFKKCAFPNHKAFVLEINEAPVSGRKIELRLSYRDFLQADTL